MILAAGLGKRLRPLTETVPKPMVEMGGRPLLEQTLLQLAALGVDEVVINVHHLAERIVEHIQDGRAWGVRVVWSREEVLLDTGGGICKALPMLGDRPFLAVNGDVAWWMDLRPLQSAMEPESMDALLGLVPVAGEGAGDFVLESDGRLRRARPGDQGWIYSGLQMVRPEALAVYPVEPFSLNRFYDDAIACGRLQGLVLTGYWADIGTLERLTLAREEWKKRFAIGDRLAYKDSGFTD